MEQKQFLELKRGDEVIICGDGRYIDERATVVDIFPDGSRAVVRSMFDGLVKNINYKALALPEVKQMNICEVPDLDITLAKAMAISRELRNVQKDHKDEITPTFGIRVADMARDSADIIDNLIDAIVTGGGKK